MNRLFTLLANRTRLVLAFLICLGVLLGALQLHPHLGLFNDDAEYLVIGDALASGQGYTWANDPLQPPHNKYPPGYPLAVAGVLLLTGHADDAYGGIIPAKLLTLLAFAGALVLLWLLLSRTQREPGFEPLLAVGLFAVNPFVLEYAVQIMSELPYTLLSLLALWAATRYGPHLQDKAPAQTRIPTHFQSSALRHSRPLRHSRESGNPPSARGENSIAAGPAAPIAATERTTSRRRIPWQQLLLLAILAVLCYYVRGVGATVVVSMVLWLLLHRQMRGAIVIGGVSAVLIGLWQVRNAIVLARHDLFLSVLPERPRELFRGHHWIH